MSKMLTEEYYNDVFLRVAKNLGEELSGAMIPDIVKAQVVYMKRRLDEVEEYVDQVIEKVEEKNKVKNSKMGYPITNKGIELFVSRIESKVSGA